MKETNMEHYRGEIEELVGDTEGSLDGFAVVDGKPKSCMDGTYCSTCDLKKYGDCYTGFIKWLMSEYKPEPVLTQREKHFVEFVQDGWLSRDEDGGIVWFAEKPIKGMRSWYGGNKLGYVNTDLEETIDLFPFITWEDEEPWSVADLRKLEVKKHETYTTKDTCTATTEHNPSSVTTAHGCITEL